MPTFGTYLCAQPPADRYGIIYLITQKESGKQYVGQTINTPEIRWKTHVHGPAKGKSLVSLAIGKYGQEVFTIETLDWAMTKDDLNHKERFWIAFLDTIGTTGYNLNEGGANGKRHPDSVAKQAAKLRGRPGHSKGTTLSKEHRESISNGLRRHYDSGAVHPSKGKPLSEETRAKISATNKGRRLPDDHPWRQPSRSSWNKGKKSTPESSIAQSKGLREYYAKRGGSPLQGRSCLPDQGGRPVLCIETGEIYPTQTAAGRAMRPGKDPHKSGATGNISKAIKRNKTAFGFHWRYV